MSFQGDSIFWVEVNKVVPNPFQPRREFDQEKLQELADSIRMYGILQPLTVTKKEIHREDGAFYSEYELIAGERRLRASKLAGLEQVPVIIRSGEQTEQEKLELAIIENLQREDLNAVDRALAFKQLSEVFELSHAMVAKKVGRSREYVSNTIRLLMLPEVMLSSMKVGEITEGHGRALLMLKDRPVEQDVVYREIMLKKLSVREVERIIRKIASDKVRKKNWVNTDPVLIEIEREFTDTLGTRVQISKTDFGGKLTIDYFSDEDLQNLLNIVKSQRRSAQVGVENGNETQSSPVVQSAGAAALAALSQATALELVPEMEAEEDEIVREAAEAAREAGIGEVAAPAPVEDNEVMQQSVAPPQPQPTYEPEPPVSQPIREESSESEPSVSEPIREQLHESTFQMSRPVESSFEPKPPMSRLNGQPSAPVSAPVASPVEKPKDPEPADEDDNLYSIRNFGL